MKLPIPLEADVQKACLELAAWHPKVAWCERLNTGKLRVKNKAGRERLFKAGFRGMSDLIGQMKDGRFLAFEVKRKGEKPTDDQDRFLRVVESHGGVAGWGGVPELQRLLDFKGSEL